MKTRKTSPTTPESVTRTIPCRHRAAEAPSREPPPAASRDRTPAPDAVDVAGQETVEVPDDVAGLETVPVETPLPVAGRLVRLRERLVKSNNVLGKGLLALLSADKIDENVWDEMEETLLLADLGTEPTLELVDALRERVKVMGSRRPERVQDMLREELVKLVDPTMDRSFNVTRHADSPTSSWSSASTAWARPPPSASWPACSSPRTRTCCWARRHLPRRRRRTAGHLGPPRRRPDREVRRRRCGPASVAYEAVKAGIEQEVDIVMIDTAGRLQNKVGLMDELGKIKRVIEKLADVDEVLLVLDATTGQNGLEPGPGLRRGRQRHRHRPDQAGRHRQGRHRGGHPEPSAYR